ncbi:MAG: alpha-amylase family glycosyl hydrolase [Ignavibacteriales bacterium]|nr:alpha-amylase family glycosyl hydrolase [Ignavibacteriales bacterium]
MPNKKKSFPPIVILDESNSNDYQPVYEFHISRYSRKKYDFAELLFSTNGNVVFANFQAARQFAFKLNEKREPGNMVRVGQVNAMGLLDEIYHYVLRQYEIQVNPDVFKRAINYVNKNLGEEKVKNALLSFIELFPSVNVYNGKEHPVDYLSGNTNEKSNYEITLEEMILLYFANFNPANNLLKELFDDSQLQVQTVYNELIVNLDKFFQNEKPFGPENQFIFDLLKTPILKNPESLEEQLKFVAERWAIILDEKFLKKILSGMDLIKEDKRFDMFGGGGAPTVVPKYKGKVDESDILGLGKSGFKYGDTSHLSYLEPERFTPDIHWMPQVVLLAKNVYVWLDQLSKKYERLIARLDQIPDAELDIIAQWNFTGLWLIGLWERSKASQKIKQIMGNQDAVPSAYSLYDYVIANDLGGEDAFRDLDKRCRQHGIRLASDMVPNHMGIFSKWIIERPHYFVQSPYPPFPNYKFTSHDLSDDPNVQLRIEDGYWNRTDAAVVFQRIDNRSGEVSYIYHGNDGTNMPWNDTAQLDMLKAEVREAVIQTIFHVARKTQIIRFDAAMTLAKIHFQRLWYPQPGTGGDIPSRADHALTRDEFDSFFPKEFWREVVDRINDEMPDTLLLAEAFWLMEGYFVRTLGMHRVYNSAFMHMMMKEENAKYRDVISNTLEFNPEILKRYVSFMSNPDEETAIKQFGTDDKYFGVATLLVTLPGLPMFGHGQIEGYTEKYGMEYRRAYYNEHPNDWLVNRHKREIFPLMRKRYIFSQVTDFWFYDFFDQNGNVNENVFAYSNRYGNDRALVIYNNKFDETKGWIKNSTGKAVGTGVGDEKRIEYTNLASALSVNPADNFYYIFKEHISELEFIRSGKEITENGFYFELQAFKYQVFMEFREVYDSTGEYENLKNQLGGNGIPNIEQLKLEIKLQPIHDAYANIFDKVLFDSIDAYLREERIEDFSGKEKFVTNRYQYFLGQIKGWYNLKIDSLQLTDEFRKGVYSIKDLNDLLEKEDFEIEESEVLSAEFRKSILISRTSNYHQNLLLYLVWLSINYLGKLFDEKEYGIKSLEIADDLLLYYPIRDILHRLGRSEFEIDKEITLLKLLTKFNAEIINVSEMHFDLINKAKAFLPDTTATKRLSNKETIILTELLNDFDVRDFLGVNKHEGIWYYSKENFEELLDWLLTLEAVSYIEKVKDKTVDNKELINFLKDIFHLNKTLKEISLQSGYKLEDLKDNISKAAS